MIYKSNLICGPGLVRTENQDNYYVNGTYRQNISDNSVLRNNDISENSGLYAIADGMGGEKDGGLASLLAVQNLNKSITSGESMSQYLIALNNNICNKIREMDGRRIGSTFAGICVSGANAQIVNLGDSRVYLFRDGELSQISKDHTAAQQLIDLGMLDIDTAKQHKDRHKLTQHLGIFTDEFIIEPYVTYCDVMPGDIFLLCSDGLTDMLGESEITQIMRTSNDISGLTESLYCAAIDKGGKDNITILLLQAEIKKEDLHKYNLAKPTSMPTPKPTPKPVPASKILSILAIISLIAAITFTVLMMLR